MEKVLQSINALVWGAPTLVMILGVGFFLTFRTGAAQLRLFPRAVKTFLSQFRPQKEKNANQISPFQALCTALAATVGTGNLAGVAGAIVIGGPGAIFWMWVCAFLGMATKFAEATLAVHFRRKEKGEYVGGPMHMISQGMGKRWHFLATVYSFFGVVAAFGVGNATQINAVITGINQAQLAFGGTPSQGGNLVIGLILAALVGAMLLGGAGRIGRVAERLVPFAAVCYLLLGGYVLWVRADRIPQALEQIVLGAFSPQAVTGGAVGSVLSTLRIGVSRGVFTNEAGMGTAGIAHGGAQVEHPAQQGLMGIMEVFLDTVVICTVTALVILVSGVAIPYAQDVGVALTSQAFAAVCGDWASAVIAAALCLFAFATVLGWGLYGARCAQYLFGPGSWKKFVYLQVATVAVSAVLKTGTVWLLSESVNGLMAIPNLIALVALHPTLISLTKEFSRRKYESIYQCQSLRALSHAEIPSSGGEGRDPGQENLSFKHRSA